MTVIKAAVLRSFGEPLVIEDLTLRPPRRVRFASRSTRSPSATATSPSSTVIGVETCPPSMATRQPGASSRSAATSLTWRSATASS